MQSRLDGYECSSQWRGGNGNDGGHSRGYQNNKRNRDSYTELTTTDTVDAAEMARTTATYVAAKDRLGEAMVIIIWTGIAPGKAVVLPQVATVGHMETGYTQVMHATIVQTSKK